MATPFDVNVPNVAQSLLGFQRARRLRQDAETQEQNRQIALERLGLLKSSQDLQRENAAANRAFRETQAADTRSFRDRQLAQQGRRIDIAQQEADTTARTILTGTKEERKLKAKETARARTLARGGKAVQSSVNRLLAKVGDPESPRADMQKRARDFEAATGPLEGTQIGQTLRAATVGETKGLTLLKQIRQDAQSINSQMQRALLKGGGSITEAERQAVDQILGNITTATSAAEARALLLNFKGIVNDMFNARLPEDQAQTSQDLTVSAPEALPQQNVPRVTSAKDASRLPSGSVFFDPDGRMRRVP